MFDNILKMKDLYNEGRGHPPSPPSYINAGFQTSFYSVFPTQHGNAPSRMVHLSLL